jgi:predicted ester cyclase
MEKNEELIRKSISLFESGKVGQFDQVFDKNIVEHTPDPTFKSDKKGIEYFKDLSKTYYEAISDFKINVQKVLNCGNQIVVVTKFEGKHTGNLGSLEPTNKNFSFLNIDIFTVENGKLTEHWGVGDNLGMLMQLGVITEKELHVH